jgi:ribosomal protein S2
MQNLQLSEQNLQLSEQYFRVLSSVKNQRGQILFVSSLDESTCSFIRSCAMSCGQEYTALSRWVPGTLTNQQWVNK